MNALQNIPIQEAREKFGIDFPFRLVVERIEGNWEYGYNLTNKATGLVSKKILFQNSTGYIESAGASVYVWK
jgi:hypothetical protein